MKDFDDIQEMVTMMGMLYGYGCCGRGGGGGGGGGGGDGCDIIAKLSTKNALEWRILEGAGWRWV